MKELFGFWFICMLSCWMFLRLVRWGEEMLRIASQIFETSLRILKNVESAQQPTWAPVLPIAVHDENEKLVPVSYEHYCWKICPDCGGSGADPRGNEYCTCLKCSGAGRLFEKS